MDKKRMFFKLASGVAGAYAFLVVFALATNDSRREPASADSERIPADEPAATDRVLTLIRGSLEEEHKKNGGEAHRDAHAKHHGCVLGEFKVSDAVPAALRAGVFAKPGASFPAWIRYSNGSGQIQADTKGDGRGMAVKLMKVPGTKILESERDAETQDFLMINHPTFFVRNAADYVAFQEATVAGNPLPFFFPGPNPLHWRLREFGVAQEILGKKVSDPLNTRYWTMTPYLVGATEVKFSARPCDAGDGRLLPTSSPDFLRENMSLHLSQSDACFDFLIQPRTLPAKMPIEDPTIEWSENDSPSVPVARITIPRQRFESPAQMEFCENLSYMPWHALPEHRPLGGINRVRKTVYEGISKFRHETNKAPRREPTGLERFD